MYYLCSAFFVRLECGGLREKTPCYKLNEIGNDTVGLYSHASTQVVEKNNDIN